MSMPISAGTPVVAAGGGTVSIAGLTEHQPAGGFANIDDAVSWRQSQLWFDRSFDRANPRAAAAVAQADEGFALLDLDRSLRVPGGSGNVPVAGWAPLDDRVVAVVDGLGARLPQLQPAAVADAAAGAMLAARPGAPVAVALDGANPETMARELRFPSRASLAKFAPIVLVGGAIATGIVMDITRKD